MRRPIAWCKLLLIQRDQQFRLHDLLDHGAFLAIRLRFEHGLQRALHLVNVRELFDVHLSVGHTQNCRGPTNRRAAVLVARHVHNVRNCHYRTETDFTPRWEGRTVRLSQVTGMDLAIMYWGSPWMAHPIVSFRFADALPICFSIETRKTIGQEYSAVRGLYRQYTLIYIVADERDSILVRSKYRHGEDVYLYRTLASPAQARVRFLEYVAAINSLRDHPRWYNAITTNCTTNIRTQRPTSKRAPWDWRMLVNGKSDELLYERHVIATGGLPFSELKRRSQINKRASDADQYPDFSRLIRDGLPKGD